MSGKLSVDEEVLFRQIHPNSLHDGEPSSDRFRPSAMDANMLSTDRSSLTSAEGAHALFTSTGRQSGAVYGVSVGEFRAEEIDCVEDSIKDHPELPDNPAHALADFSPHAEKKQKLIAKRLKSAAIARGCLFKPLSN